MENGVEDFLAINSFSISVPTHVFLLSNELTSQSSLENKRLENYLSRNSVAISTNIDKTSKTFWEWAIKTIDIL